MPTRNISLTAEQDAFVQEVVEAGEYQNASEAIRDALRVLQQRRREDRLKLKALRAQIKAGIDALALPVQAGVDAIAAVGGQGGAGQTQQQEGGQQGRSTMLQGNPPGRWAVTPLETHADATG